MDGKTTGGTPSGDAAIIFSCQAVEHYEIAGYGTARTYAQLLGDQDAVRLLELDGKRDAA